MDIFKLIGSLGLILIIMGLLIKSRKNRDIIYIAGGVCLTAYSIYINDLIFIILQIAFTLAAVYDLVRISRK